MERLPDTIYFAILFIKKLFSEVQALAVLLTFDQPLYIKAADIVASPRSQFLLNLKLYPILENRRPLPPVEPRLTADCTFVSLVSVVKSYDFCPVPALTLVLNNSRGYVL